MRFAVAELAFNEMGQRIASAGFVAQAKVNFRAVFGAHVQGALSNVYNNFGG